MDIQILKDFCDLLKESNEEEKKELNRKHPKIILVL